MLGQSAGALLIDNRFEFMVMLESSNGMVVATSSDGTVNKTVFTEVFVKRNGAWQAVNAQECRSSRAPTAKASVRFDACR